MMIAGFDADPDVLCSLAPVNEAAPGLKKQSSARRRTEIPVRKPVRRGQSTPSVSIQRYGPRKP
jgi:hypothetical protein